MKTPLSVVQAQFDAYNGHDLERFIGNFSDSCKVYRMPSFEPVITRKSELADFYANERFNRPTLKAELISRVVLGNKVFDRERILGVTDEPIEVMAVFEVIDGLIQNMWSFFA